METVEVSRCSRCEQIKPADQFPRSKKSRNGLSYWCKQCMRERNAERYREEPEFRTRIAEQSKRWRIENDDRNRENSYRWWRSNKEKASAQQREYRRKNPEVARKSSARRRARELGAPYIPYTKEQLSQRWAYYGGKCWMCGAEATEIDHVKPLAKGGPEMLANLRPACRSCNASKLAKWPFKVSD